MITSPDDARPTPNQAAAARNPDRAFGLRGLTRHGSWLRQAGVAGFVLFLVKGLLWLAVPGFFALRRLLVD